MKYFTLLVALCATLFTTVLVAQPTTSATAPTKAAADVLSIFSGAYTDVSGTNFNPGWGQGTLVTDYTISGTSDVTKKYATLDYQGTEFSTINVAAYSALHLDVWSDVVTSFQLFPINTGQPEKSVTKTTVVGWNSFEIPISDFTALGLPMTSVYQFKVQELGFAYHAGTKTIYLDNIYFWKPANVPTLTGFTIAAKLTTDAAFTLTAPTSPSAGAFTYTSGNTAVATISGNTVTIVGAGTSVITADQAANGAYAAGSTSASLVVSSPGPTTAAPTPTTAAATVISLYSGTYTDLSGTGWNRYNGGTAYTEVSIATNATQKYTNLGYSVSEPAATIDATAKTHLHIDVWTATANTNFKIKLVDFGANGVYQGTPNDDTESEISVTPNPGNSAWVSYDIALSDFATLAAKAHLAQFIISSADAGRTFYLDNIYFYTAAVAPTAPTAAAPTPTRPAANVAAIYCRTYTAATTTNWNVYNGGTSYTEPVVAGNAVQRYANLSYSVAEHATQINATNATYLHLDVWTANARNFLVKLVDFGANGVYSFSPTAGDDTEGEVTSVLAANTDAAVWTSLDIPLTSFAAAGLANKAHLAQFVVSSPSIAAIYVDNVYLYANAVLAVELTTLKAKAVNTTTVLTWQTASEKDNAGFTIERSADATNFTAIGNVKGNGTTNATSDYTFTDATPLSGVNYYRLRQADVNGKETMSKVVSVLFGKTGLVLRNTLVHDALEVVVSESEVGPLSIFNVSGQLVYATKVQGTQRIDLSNLSAGVYIVRTQTGEARRFVKD